MGVRQRREEHLGQRARSPRQGLVLAQRPCKSGCKEDERQGDLAGVAASSTILATLQTDAGAVAVANAVPATGSFTIKLTAAPTKSVKVAWMVLG